MNINTTFAAQTAQEFADWLAANRQALPAIWAVLARRIRLPQPLDRLRNQLAQHRLVDVG